MRTRPDLVFAKLLLASRWVMAPLAMGLVVALVIVLVQFGRELVEAVLGFSVMTGSLVMLAVLKLIDLVLIANLALMIIGAAVGAFVAPSETPDRGWAESGITDFVQLKLRVFAYISAIAAIELLESFVDIEALSRHARPPRQRELDELKAKTQARLEETLGPQCEYLAAIRAELPDDGIYVEDLTQVGYVGRLAFPVYRPRTYIHSGYQGTLGHCYATALGAKVACPDNPVVSISGDGGFMYNVQELATAALHGIDVVAIVFADGAYGNVRRMQKNDYGNKLIAVDLLNPNFPKMAESYGIAGVRATSPDELRRELSAAFKRHGPSLIEVPVGEMPDPWPTLIMPRVRGR